MGRVRGAPDTKLSCWAIEITFWLRCSQMSDPLLLAAVDLGSNSFRLLIGRAESSPTGVQVLPIDVLKEGVRLAGGLDRERNLTAQSQRIAVEALQRFGERLRAFHPHSVRAVATSALRQAKNARHVLSTFEAALGFPIEVIAGREEARLIWIGAAHTLPADGSNRMVLDIGGGSTECIIGRDYAPVLTESVTIGCVGLTRQLFEDGEIRREAQRRAVLVARDLFAPLARPFRNAGWVEAVGTSGTVKVVADLCLESFGAQSITREGLSRLESLMLKAGHLERLRITGLRADRRAVLPGGLAILIAAFDEFGIESMRYTYGALREGVLYDLLGRTNDADMRDVTVEQSMLRYGVDREHAARVGETAGQIWRNIGRGVENLQRGADLLRWAASLDEIGLSISHSAYHKHSAYIVANADLPGFSKPDQTLLSRLVLGHTGKLTKMTGLIEVDAEWRMLLALRLAVILHRRRDDMEGAHRLALDLVGRSVTLNVARDWAAQNPLSDFSLSAEVAEWARAGLFEKATYQALERLPGQATDPLKRVA